MHNMNIFEQFYNKETKDCLLSKISHYSQKETSFFFFFFLQSLFNDLSLVCFIIPNSLFNHGNDN